MFSWPQLGEAKRALKNMVGLKKGLPLSKRAYMVSNMTHVLFSICYWPVLRFWGPQGVWSSNKSSIGFLQPSHCICLACYALAIRSTDEGDTGDRLLFACRLWQGLRKRYSALTSSSQGLVICNPWDWGIFCFHWSCILSIWLQCTVLFSSNLCLLRKIPDKPYQSFLQVSPHDMVENVMIPADNIRPLTDDVQVGKVYMRFLHEDGIPVVDGRGACVGVVYAGDCKKVFIIQFDWCLHCLLSLNSWYICNF